MNWLAYALLITVGTAVHLWRRPAARKRAIEVALAWNFGIGMGLAGLMGFVGHTVRADATAAYIGSAPGSGFQSEVAIANLCFAVLGVLALRLRGGFWLATGLLGIVFFLGANVHHLADALANGNPNPGNYGAINVYELVWPATLAALLVAYARHHPAALLAG
jgi:hypothetical protein